MFHKRRSAKANLSLNLAVSESGRFPQYDASISAAAFKKATAQALGSAGMKWSKRTQPLHTRSDLEWSHYMFVGRSYHAENVLIDITWAEP